MTTIAELMTRDPVTVSPSHSVQRAAQLMDELNVGVLPVCRDGKLVGIVTDRDITVRAIAAGLIPMNTAVDLVMSEGVRHCHLDQSPAEVLQQMASVQIRRLPVLDEQQNLVGIVSLGDIAAHSVGGLVDGVDEALRRISTPSAPDRVTAAV